MRLTHKEQQVVSQIASCIDAYGGELCWATCIADYGPLPRIKGKELAGVMSSLVKKGVIVSYWAPNPKDSTVSLTSPVENAIKESKEDRS